MKHDKNIRQDLASHRGGEILAGLMMVDELDNYPVLSTYPLTEMAGLKRWGLLGLDAFGDYFVLSGGEVHFVLIETGEVCETWPSYEVWLQAVVNDPDGIVGLGFLLAWEETFGRLPRGKRLMPKIPFFCGGEYDFDNIFACPIDEVVGVRAIFATQTKDLPDGARILIETVD